MRRSNQVDFVGQCQFTIDLFFQVFYKYKRELENEDEEDIICYDGNGTVSSNNHQFFLVNLL